MKKSNFIWIAALALHQLAVLPHAAVAGDDSQADGKQIQATAPAPEEKGPPLPLHAFDGGGGLLITPVALLVNPSERLWGVAGLPSASFTVAKPGAKDAEALNVTETFFKRVELGYSGSRFGTYPLNNAVFKETGIHLTRDDVYLNDFTTRVAILNDGDFGIPYIPAITAGANFKWNSGIGTINHELGDALSTIGYRKDHGIDYTVTASKIVKGAFTLNRPLLLSTGVRFSQDQWLGYVGFSDKWAASVEANAAYSITDWLWLAAEYRQNPNHYGSGITVGGEKLVRTSVLDWWDVGVAFVLNKHATLTVGYGNFGDVLNSDARGGWATQLKYEF